LIFNIHFFFEFILSSISKALIDPSFYDGPNNQRLELIGDSIIGFSVTLHLFHSFPSTEEGCLTRTKIRMISNPSLVKAVEKLGLDRFLLHNNKHLLVDCPVRNVALGFLFESIVGAVVLDFKARNAFQEGINWAYKFVEQTIVSQIEKTPEQIGFDPKTLLQHRIQQLFHKPPLYEIVSISKLEYYSLFKVQVSWEGQAFIAEGKTVKEAEHKAALLGLKFLDSINNNV
jgi:ribonuclease-3